jgi:LuxR family maltose regulon positive regulatory protein
VPDDYHCIREKSVHDLVTELLAHPAHLLLLARRDPSLPLSSLRGRRQMTEIQAADLRFTPAEAAEFLNNTTKVFVDDAAATLLEEKTEGWVTPCFLAVTGKR